MEPYWLMYHINARFDKRGNWGGGGLIYGNSVFSAQLFSTLKTAQNNKVYELKTNKTEPPKRQHMFILDCLAQKSELDSSGRKSRQQQGWVLLGRGRGAGGSSGNQLLAFSSSKPPAPAWAGPPSSSQPR